MRYSSPVIFMRRTVTRDYTMNGQDYHQGDKAVLYYYAANRDEAVFPDPERFDIARSPNPHVGFGAPGPHFCLGAHLARRELTVMLRELLTRVPDITTAGAEKGDNRGGRPVAAVCADGCAGLCRRRLSGGHVMPPVTGFSDRQASGGGG